jgi:hypothetical protein
MDALENREQWGETLERLTGIYRVLKPHLIETYGTHLAQTNPVYEPPTRRILERCLEEERRHVAEALPVLAGLLRTAGDPGRGERWAGELGALLAEAGGVAGGQA